MKKSLLAVLSIVIILAFLLTACTGNTSATEAASEAATEATVSESAEQPAEVEQVSIRVAVTQLGSDTPYENMIAAFEAANPDIDVAFESISQDQYNTTIRTQLTSNNAPDIFLTSQGFVEPMATGTLAVDGFLLDLSAQPWASRIDPTMTSTMSYEGKLYQLPVQFVSMGAMYNPALFEEKGLSVPTTWTELLAFCDAANAQGIVPIALGAQVPFASQLIVYPLVATTAYGPTPDLDAQMQAGKATFSDSGWKEGITKFAELNDHGCFNEGAVGTAIPAAQEMFTTGQAATYVFYTGLAGALEAQMGVDLASFVLPASDVAEDQQVMAAPGYGWAANAQTANPEAVYKFLDFAANAGAEAFATETDWPPVLSGVSYTPSAVNAPVFAAIEAGKVATWPDQSWPNADVQQVMWAKLQELLSGQASVDDVLSAMDQAYVGE